MTPTEPTFSCWLNCILRCLICTNVVNSTRLRARPENNHHSEHAYKCYITQSSLNRPCLLQHDTMLIFVLKDIFQQLRHQHRVYHIWKFRCLRPFPSAPLLILAALCSPIFLASRYHDLRFSAFLAAFFFIIQLSV
jgi:hypothetical protein